MTLGDIIYQWRHSKEHKMSQQEFGEKIGTSRMYISMLENNYNPSTGKPINPSLTVLKACADAMNIDIDILMKKLDDNQLIYLDETKYNEQFINNNDLHNKELTSKSKNDSNVFPVPDKPIPVPIIGDIAAGLPILANQNIIGYAYLPESEFIKRPNSFYLTVKGDSMNKKFQNGDLVLIDPDVEVTDGDIAAVLIDDEATVKEFHNGDGVIILQPLSTNKEHQMQIYNIKKVKIKIIGKVVSFQGKV